uniref:Photolyase/cryptochrome alpha/beta domain-containing protein n=1 Tax=Picocystis salinarum TaxID=88271 RepID=A0A7S3UFW6_9CHLO
MAMATWSAMGARQVRPKRDSVPCLRAEERALVWFTRDLRTDDHAGLVAAARARCKTAALLVIDPTRQRSASAASAVAAAKELRHRLDELGVQLIVRVGKVEEEVLHVAEAVQASVVLVQDDAEASWKSAAHAVREKDVRLVTWKSRLRDTPSSSWATPMEGAAQGALVAAEKRLEDQGLGMETYRAFEEGRPEQAARAAATAMRGGTDRGADLQRAMVELKRGTAEEGENFRRTKRSQANWTRPPLSAPENIVAMDLKASEIEIGDIPNTEALRQAIVEAIVVHPCLQSLYEERAAEVSDDEAARVAATSKATKALQAYLERDDSERGDASLEEWRSELLRAAEKWESERRGSTLSTAFADAFELGTLTPRMMRTIAKRVLRKSGGGRLGDSSQWTAIARAELDASPARTVALAAESHDFHLWLAQEDERREERAPGATSKWWRWKGRLCHYNVAGVTDANSTQGNGGGMNENAESLSVVLVHGFGASADHFRRNFRELADAGYRVYALTMPGFGRSEKPPDFAYSQRLWVDSLKDFLLEVVKEPAVIAGNSIGGYISAQLAAECPEAITGLVLINTAGKIGGEVEPSTTKPAPKDLVVVPSSLTLLWYLERNIEKTLKRCYPQRPDNADAWLAEEIYRAACDPGSLRVFSSAFYLPPPVPLNVLVRDRYAGPTLVLQGVNDPLNDAKDRAAQLEKLCHNVEVKRLEAGHCPHDEVPEEVNSALIEWMHRISQIKRTPVELQDAV